MGFNRTDNCPSCDDRFNHERKHRPRNRAEKWLILFLLTTIGISLLQVQKNSSEQCIHHPLTPLKERSYSPPATLSQASFNLFASVEHPAPVDRKAEPYLDTTFLQRAPLYPFYVAEKVWNPDEQKYDFYREGSYGSEVLLRGDARRHFISENQNDYPEPESGCGPTALLNLYIWYSKFGLLKESITHADPGIYKQLKFKQIDRKLLQIQRQSRTDVGGTNTLAGIVAMDSLVQKYAREANTRLHFEIKKPPLGHKDFLDLSRHYRAGLLSVRPKDKITGRLLGNHSVLCIRGDTSGRVTIANWGQYWHGRLVQRGDSQWFIPSDPSHHELLINHLTVLVPFRQNQVGQPAK